MIKGKKGDKVLSVYWFIILFLVAGAIAYMTINFFGKPANIKDIEANALTNKIADCISEGGYLREGILANEEFKTNVLANCNLNFNVEDVSDWKQQKQYYFEFSINKFDSSVPDDIGEKLYDLNYGNPNLKTAYLLERIKEKKRLRAVDLIVIHYTEGLTAMGAIAEFERGGGETKSIHYILDRDGTIYSLGNYDSVAFRSEEVLAGHAGCLAERPSCHSNTEKPNPILYEQDKNCCRRGINQRSIGIEIVNLGIKCGDANSGLYCGSKTCKEICENTGEGVNINGVVWEKYTEEQINSLSVLVSGIASRYNIPIDREHIIGHEEVDPGRKVDPGPAFPWEEFMSRIQKEELTSQPASWAGRNFYVIDKNNSQYTINILSVIGKNDKNEA